MAEEVGKANPEDAPGVGTPGEAAGEIPSQETSSPTSGDAPASGVASTESAAASAEGAAASTETGASPVEAVAAKPEPVAAAPNDAGEATDQAAIDELLRQAAFDDPSAVAEAAPAAAAVAAPEADEFKLPNFNQVMQDAQISSIDLLKDVELNVKIELGRSRMLVEDVLRLGEGSVVELDKLAGDPVDVFVNDRLVARGEVLVLNDNFCVRVNEILAGAKEEF